MRPRVVLHADMDAFYAAVEQRDRPELRGKPVIVGGTSTRGVVMAASYEARPFGVRSAMPSVQARKLCPHAIFLPGDMAKYRRVSAQVREVFESVSPEVEPISLDEAFIDVTGSVALLGPPLDIGRLLKRRVREATGLAVSVGIGPGKMVAKIASDACKPDGLLEVAADGVAAFLHPLPVARLWGVGPITQAALARAGIATIADLAARDERDLERLVGSAASSLVALARGMDVRTVEAERAAKSYGEEGTFGADTTADRTIRSAIIAHAEAVARRLRHDGVRGRVVVLKIKLARSLGGGRFPLLTRRTTLPEPTDDGKAISDAALGLWAREYHGPVRLIGVSVADMAGGSAGQLEIFADARTTRREALNDALDRIVARWGRDSIARAGAAAEEQGFSAAVKRGE